MNRLSGLILVLILFVSLTAASCSEPEKPPAVAGAFYPADGKALQNMVDTFLKAASKKDIHGTLIAIISPHAGYQFSGRVAAYSYININPDDYDTIILIGPSHYTPFHGVSVYTEGSFLTPLGKIRINKKIARALINEKADVRYYPKAFEKEHSLEVQLPFLQRRIKKNFSIVPILIGTPTTASFRYLTSRLTEIMRNNSRILLIASTDLSHYHNYNTAVEIDRKTTEIIERMSVEELEACLSRRDCEMCGAYPVLYTMTIARNLGATNGILFKYANSGDVTGDKSRVVGYAAMGLYRTPLTEKQKKTLLEIARKTIFSYVRTGKPPEFNVTDKRLLANGATFVTIKRGGGILRGCIGNIFPYLPLYRSVIRNAVAAASRDPRFPPMRKEELKDIEVEVTVLSPLEPVGDIREIEVGKHGLYIMKDNHSGILLPQVPVEFGWDRKTFLQQVSLKAGLPGDAWKEAQLYKFTAEIITEHNPQIQR